MDLKQHIGIRVRAARTRRGLTQEGVAGQIGKAVETISNIERGHAYTGLETLEKPRVALGTPIRDFFEEAEATRSVPRERLELEHRLRDLARLLSDDDAKVALELVDVIARHRRRHPRAQP
ncbi:MAG: helix-turn-helix transcriptional regulator, partial [Planctomycetes bacterium]|nr:helix-turn-helix transcriptional regulator [Planctomycetota bacterium]